MEKIVKTILALALVGGLFIAGWRIYRRLPVNISERANIEATYGRATTFLIVVLGNRPAGATLNSPIELYPFDVAAAQRQFRSTPQLGKQFEDYLARQIKDIRPVKASTDGSGRAVAMLSEGNWWLRATASSGNGELLEWRLPVSVSGRQQTIELSTENLYERTKKF